MRPFFIFATAFVFGISTGAATAEAEQEAAAADAVEALVKKFGFPSKGLAGAELARSLLLNEGAHVRVRALIEDLSASDFSGRERAVADLIGIPAPIDGALWEARMEADPGLSILLDRTLETRQSLRSLERTGYLFQLIAHEPIEGLAIPVARTATAFDLARDLEVVLNGVSAAVETAVPDDEEGLRAVISGEPGKVHIVAIAGLAAIAIRGGSELPEVTSGPLRLGVAYALASLGDRRAPGYFVDLLESESVLIRSESARMLDACTGGKMKYAGAFDPLPSRLEVVKWWRNWMAGEGANLEIEAVSAADDWRGITAVSASGEGGARVLEIGMAGAQERVYASGVGGMNGIPGPVYQGDDDRTLILCSAGGNASSLHLYDPEGRWLWSADGLPEAGGVTLLSGGNFLLSDASKPALNEFDWLGAKVGERQIGAIAKDLQTLPGGRLLATVPTENAIVEYDLSGVEIWRMENLEGVRFARRLPNGHHLVVHAKGLSEYDAAGIQVWSVEKTRDGVWGEILSAARRVGGNTYLGTDTGLHEISPGLRVLKKVTDGQINSLEAY